MTTVSVRYDPNATYEIESQDVEYRRDGATSWLARVTRPKGAGPFPALLDVHGGAWANGDRLMNDGTDQALAASGLVIVAIDFRTSLNAPSPAAMEDINYGIRWLKAHAAEFGASPEQVGGVGWSSGGHQIMLAGMRPRQYATLPLAEAPSLDASLAYVIMGWPVIDPLARHKLAEGRGNKELMENHLRYFGSEAGMIAESPPHIARSGQSIETPPALLVQGAADEALTRMMAEDFVEAYSLAGGIIELAKYPGEPHGFLRQPGPNSARALAMIKSFIARHLAG
ncbi:MAG TPA: alpha/beta hydrolase [Dehalococcoidia bacterium]|nr:alpha/beta hydrolase [Dehalococcoidia bacterium]